jgi:hypothetical protein
MFLNLWNLNQQPFLLFEYTWNNCISRDVVSLSYMLSKRNNSLYSVRIEVTQWWFPVWWIWTAGPRFSVKLLFETHFLSLVLYAGALHGVWKPLMSVNCFDKISCTCTSSMISDVNHCLTAMMFLSFSVRLPTQGDVSLSICSCIFGAENSSFIFLWVMTLVCVYLHLLQVFCYQG